MWKTVSARLRGAEAELKDMGEDTEGLVETTSKLRGLVKGMTGFDIMKDENTYKSIYEIVVGIGEKWGELTDIQQASLLESLAGKLQSNRLAAALQNVDQLKKVYETAENSAGSAEREQAHYAESVQYSIDSMKASAESLASTFLKSDVLKGAIDTASKFLDILEAIIDKIGGIPTVASIAAIALDKMMNINLFSRKRGEYGEDIGMQRNFSANGVKDFFRKNFTAQPVFDENEVNALKQYNQLLKDGKESTKAFATALENQRPVVQNFAKATDDLDGALANIPKQNKALTFLKSLGTSLLNMGIFTAISVGISLLIKLFDKLIVTEKEMREATESLSSTLKNLDDTHKSNIQTINSVKDRYYELSNGVNDLGRNISLSSDEYEEYKGIISQLSDVMPNLTARYNEQGEKVGFLTGNIKDLNKALAEQEQLEYSKLLNNDENGQGENISNIVKGLNKGYKGNILTDNPISGLLKTITNDLASLFGATKDDDIDFLPSGLESKIQDTKDQIEDLESTIERLKDKRIEGISGGDASSVVSGLDSTKEASKVQNEYNKQLDESRAKLLKLQAEQKVNAQALSSLASVYAKVSEEYTRLDETSKGYIDNLLNISPENINDVMKAAEEAGESIDVYMAKYSGDVVSKIAENKGGVSDLIKKLLDFDSSGMSDAEIQESVNKLLARISNIIGIDANELKIRFGFEFVDENAKSAQEHIKRISKNSSGYVDQVDLANMEKWTKDLHLNNEQLAYIEKSGYKARDGYEALKKAAEEANKAIDETNSKDITIDTHINTVDTAKTDIATLQDSYADYKDGGGTVDVDKLNSVAENIKADKEAYQEFLNVLTEVPEDTKAVQEAYNNLVTSYIDGQDVLKGLTTDNIEYTASELKKMGVVNAMEVAESRLAQAAQTDADKTNILKYATDQLTNSKDKATYASKDFASATATDIINLANEKGVSESTRIALYQLALEKINTNLTTISEQADIEELNRVMGVLGDATEKWKAYYNMKKNQTTGKGPHGSGVLSIGKGLKKQNYTVPTQVEDAITKYAQEDVDDAKDKPKEPKVNYNPGATSTSPTPAGNNKTPSTKQKKTKQKKELNLTRQLYDWIERRLDLLSKAVDRAKSKMERLLDWDKKKNATKKAIEAVRTELNATYQAAKRYFDYGKKIAKEEAKAAAKDAKKNGSKKQADKYGKNLTKKQIKDYTKLVEEGRIGEKDLQSIKDPRIKAFVDTLIQWNDKAKACLETADDLRDEMADLYETLANNPIDKCAEQVEKLSDKMTILEKKSSNMITKLGQGFTNLSAILSDSTNKGTYLGKDFFEAINKLANAKLENATKQLQSYADAYSETIVAYKTAQTEFTEKQTSTGTYISGLSAKKLGLTKDQYSELQKYIRSGEEVPAKLKNLIATVNTTAANKVGSYNEYFIKQEKMKEALDSAMSTYELQDEEHKALTRQFLQERFNNAKQGYDRLKTVWDDQINALASQVDLMEQYGMVLDRRNYDVQIDTEKERIELLEKEREVLKAYLSTIPEGSAEWYESKDAVNALNEELSTATSKVMELQQKANDINRTIYELKTNVTKRISDEFAFISDLMEGVEDFNPVTHLATDEGYSRLFSYMVQMQNAKGEAQRAKEIVEELNNAIEKGVDEEGKIKLMINGAEFKGTLKDAQDALEYYYDQWRDQIKLTKEQENNLIEWEISKLEEEVSLAQELVDKRKDALTAEKNLHDYQRSIQDATTNINNLQKQITVLGGDNSQEGKARIQALQKQLKDAQQNLKETEYDRYISDQQDMLDNLMEEYTTLTDEEKLHREELFNRALNDVALNTEKINGKMHEVMETYGYKPEYAQGILEWLKSPEVKEYTQHIKHQLDSAASDLGGVDTTLGGLLKDFNSAFSTGFSKALTTQLSGIASRAIESKISGLVSVNSKITELSNGEAVIDNHTSVKIRAGAEDTTNAGGTGDGNGYSGGAGDVKVSNNPPTPIFSNTTSPTESAKNSITGAGNVPNVTIEDPNEKASKELPAASDNAIENLLNSWGISLQNPTEGKPFASLEEIGLTGRKGMGNEKYGYKAVNQLIMAATGKVLSTEGLKQLAYRLNVSYDNSGVNGNLFKAITSYPVFGSVLYQNWHEAFDKYKEIMNIVAQQQYQSKSKYTEYEKVGINKKLIDKYGRKLGTNELSYISSILGITNTTSDLRDESGELYKKLHKLGVFAKGGLVKAVKNRGEDGIAMVRDGEGILTPAQTKTFSYELAPRIDDIIDSSKIIKDATSNFNKLMPTGDTNVEATFQFDLENVTSASDIIKQIQSNNNVQNAIRSVTVDRIAGGSRLGVNMYR